MWISPTEMEIPLLQIISYHNKQVTFLVMITMAVMILRNAVIIVTRARSQ